MDRMIRRNVLAFAILSTVLAYAAAAQTAVAPQIGGHFELTTTDGHDVTEQDYRGKWLLVYFGYTYCPDVCPTVLNEMGTALDELGPRAKHIQPIFISIDPTRDSQKVMAKYLKSFDPRIVGLRGDGDATEEAAKAFHVYYRARTVGHGEYVMDHSAFIYVLNPKGKFVQLLSADVPGHRLAEVLKKLVK
jgi:protein SCO1/2